MTCRNCFQWFKTWFGSKCRRGNAKKLINVSMFDRVSTVFVIIIIIKKKTQLQKTGNILKWSQIVINPFCLFSVGERSILKYGHFSLTEKNGKKPEPNRRSLSSLWIQNVFFADCITPIVTSIWTCFIEKKKWLFAVFWQKLLTCLVPQI